MASTISAGTTTTTALVQTADTSGVLQLQTNGTTTAVTIDTSQNVGLGVTPSAWSGVTAFQNKSASVAVTSNGNNMDLATNRYYNGTNDLFYQTGNYALMYEQASGSGAHRWFTSTASGTAGNAITFTQAMTLASSGNLLVGTGTDPGTGYTGVFQTNSTAGAAGFYFYNTSASAVGNGVVSVCNTATSGANYLFYGVSGASAINTGTQAFIVKANGNVVNINNSYGAISDAKLKHNITLSGSQWNDVKALGSLVKKYSLITDETNTQQIGWIAQDAQTVSPGLVYSTPDKDIEGNLTGESTLGINYSVAYMKAFKALSEALVRIEQLETQVTALQSKG